MLRTPFGLLTVLLLVAVSLGADPAGGAGDKPGGEIAAALRTREYEKAVGLIDQALPAAGAADRELLLYERGLALLYGGKHADALGQFEQQLKEFPTGAWAQKAEFRRADAHVAMKEFEAAEQIYAAAVRALVGEQRKAEIAGVYLGFADDYFAPKDALSKPDYERARSFYDRALELEPGDALRDELLFKRAMCGHMLSKWDDAAGEYERYLTEFDDDYRALEKQRRGTAPLPPAAAQPGRHAVEARLALTQCRFYGGKLLEARRVGQDLLKLLGKLDPDRVQFRDSWIETTYILAGTYGMPKPAEGESLAMGVQILRKLLEAYPAAERAIRGAYDIGAAYAALGRTDEAIAAFNALIERQVIRPDTEETRKVAEELSQDALHRIGELQFAQKKYAEAIGVWNQYIAKYPTGPRWSAAQQAIVDAEYQVGADAVADEHYDAARQAWTQFLEKHPLDGRNAGILYTFGEMAYVEQEKLEEAGKPADWNEPLAHWRRLVSKFPQSEEAGRAQLDTGRVLEAKLQDLPGAIEAYQKLNWSAAMGAAQQRVTELRATRLLVRTERTFRSNEPVKIRVDARNIDKLSVKLYRIDMQDYFRKTHALGGVERLDLLLIDPDKTLTLAVPGYAAYKPVTQEIELPCEGPGVWAVNVSNEAAEAEPPAGGPIQRIEATTLVVRSDLDVIVKSSRRQVLVFAQDMLTQEPAAGVHVLVSDGGRVRVEGTTGADGVWLAKADQFEQDASAARDGGTPAKALKDLEYVSVLAERDGHVAGNALSLEGLAFSTGLQPRGYLYTDRPAYRPGEAVNIRGVLREVKEGQYALPTQPEDERLRWKLDVLDAKGRTLSTSAIEPDDFGCFAARFHVASDGATGTYKLIVRRPDGPMFTGQFDVQTYELPKAWVRFDLADTVVLRGEPIKGSLVVTYNYGEPVVGKTVEYGMQLWTGEPLNKVGVTDQDGKVTFEFDSTLFPEEGQVVLQARQADLDINTAAKVFVAVRAYRATVTTARPDGVFLADEPIEVTVKTTDLKGDSTGQEMTLTALLRTQSRGQWVETKVESAAVKTDEKTGVGRATLRLTKGGLYVLRAEGRDRFDHVVVTDTQVAVSDAEDVTRVRLFSERQHYKVGETIDLDIHSRVGVKGEAGGGAPADKAAAGSAGTYLALVTYEAEDIIGYRTLRLAPGHNALPIPVDNTHFPNFAVGVTVMEPGRAAEVSAVHPANWVQTNRPGRLHSATREFTVERELHVTLTPDKTTYHPREELKLELAVTDQQGKPVQAEVGVAMIDKALLSRFADNTPPIVSFFQEGARRVAALRTEASCTFAYAASTRSMVTELLAEARRQEEEGTRMAFRSTSQPVVGDIPRLSSLGYAVSVNGDGVPMSQVERATGNRLGTVVGGGQAGGGYDMHFYYSTSNEGAGGGGSGGQLFQNMQNNEQGQTAGRWLEYGAPQGQAFEFSGYSNLAYGYQMPQRRGQVAQSAERRFQAEERLANVLVGGTSENVARVIADLNLSLLEAPPRSYFPEVAYWNPRVVTDADGKASVTIIVPDSSTTWQINARGVTPETLVGDGQIEVVSKHDFFVELTTPPTLIDGDRFEPHATLHCLTPYEGKIDVTLRVGAKSEPEAPARVGDSKSTAPPGADNSEPAAPASGGTPVTRTIEIHGTGTFDVAFDPIPVPDAAVLVLEVTAQAQSPVSATDARRLADAFASEIPIRAWGMPVEAHAAGVGQDTTFVEVELPAVKEPERAYHDRHLTVAVGPSVQRWLIEEALEAGPRWQFIEHRLSASQIAPPRTYADTASSLLGCLYAANYARAQQAAGDSADVRLLSERALGLIAQLLSTQMEDGGWSWSGQPRESDPWTTAQVAWALGKARADGHPVADQAMNKLTAYLRKAFADADTGQHELKATVLHGLSWVADVDFAHVNRLHRSRENLSNAALAHLALTFVKLDRKSAATEVLATLAQRMSEGRGEPPVCWLSTQNSSAWAASEVEVTALALLAQLNVDPTAASVPKMVGYLTAAARADGWQPHKARGSVLAALAVYYAAGEQQAANYTLTVGVNGKELRKLTSDETGSVRIDLGEAELAAGKQRVDFTFNGRGQYAFAVTLSAFSRGYPDAEKQSKDALRVFGREVLPPPREYHGRAVPFGFSITREHKHFRNLAKHLPVGAVATVEIGLQRMDKSENGAGDREYAIVKETIPAGFRLLPETVEGNFLAQDYRDNTLTLYYGTQRGLNRLVYKMVATTPGEYRLPPTIIRSLYNPDVVQVNKTAEPLMVLARGAESPDAYRPSADELYNFGKLYFDDGDYAAAAENLEALLAGEWLLADEPYRESVRMLLTAALVRDDPARIVNYFEILKEKYPDLVVPFGQIVQVADAYARTGQHERAYLVYRATADASFVRDAGVGGMLQQEGRFLDSIDFLEGLWRVYPDTPQVEGTYYALAQALYAQAQKADAVRPRKASAASAASADRPETDAAEARVHARSYVTRDELIREAAGLLERFEVLYSASPVADEAYYSLATAYLDLDDYWTAINRAREAVDRFAQSKWLDRFRYIEALALFHLNEFDRARELAKVVSESTYRDEQGVERASPNKWLALYIIGQIFDAQSKPAEAIKFYEQVRERFADADQALRVFEQKRVELPEVTVFHPYGGGFLEGRDWEQQVRNVGAAGARTQADAAAAKLVSEPVLRTLPARGGCYGQPFVRIDYRNVKSAVLQVYRVDLLKLALVEKNLTQITAVNLAGIQPTVTKTVELGDGRDYADKSVWVGLDVVDRAKADAGDGTGAYLVICRGDDLFSSGLVLVTPVTLEVQEDVASQRARVNVVDAVTRRGVSGVHVKVIGTGMGQFVTGQADLRGVFVAEPVNGYPTVIARDAGGHFAFYRSEGAVLAAATPPVSAVQTPRSPAKPQGKADYLENVSQEQQQIRDANGQRLKGMFEKKQKGVEVKASH